MQSISFFIYFQLRLSIFLLKFWPNIQPCQQEGEPLEARGDGGQQGEVGGEASHGEADQEARGRQQKPKPAVNILPKILRKNRRFETIIEGDERKFDKGSAVS